MLRIAVVLTGLALPSVALADACDKIHASIAADFNAAADDAARLIQRRFDLFSLASNQTGSQLEAVARQAGEQAAAIILQAEISRRNERAAIDMLCPISLP
jgi:hypothetical protein